MSEIASSITFNVGEPARFSCTDLCGNCMGQNTDYDACGNCGGNCSLVDVLYDSDFYHDSWSYLLILKTNFILKSIKQQIV